jgi:hypothetical protein
VGQVANLQPIANRPDRRRVANPPQDAILPYKV